MYEWDVLSGKREKECVVKSCGFTCLTLTPDLRTTFVVSSDSSLNEMILADSTVRTLIFTLGIVVYYS